MSMAPGMPALPLTETLGKNTVTSIFAVGLAKGTSKIELVPAQVNGVPGVPQTGSDPLLGNKDVSFANFWEPNAFSDPRCFFDSSTSTFFFTVIGFLQSGPDKGNTSIDVAVFNTSGFAVYQIDSSFG